MNRIRYIVRTVLAESIKNLKFVVTGTLSIPRSQIYREIEDAGGIIQNSIKKDTSYLVLGSDVGYGKTSKARQLGIPTVTERELRNMMKGSGRPSSRELTAWRGSGKYGTHRIGRFRGDYLARESAKLYESLIEESVEETYAFSQGYKAGTNDAQSGEYKATSNPYERNRPTKAAELRKLASRFNEWKAGYEAGYLKSEPGPA